MIKFYKGNKVSQIFYPDGTMKIDIEPIPAIGLAACSSISIDWHYENEHETLILMYLANHLKNVYHKPLVLNMPYLPNARMDRTHNESEVFTLKYFCQMINSIGFEQVNVVDAHSSVGPALLNNVNNLSPLPYISKFLSDIDFDPDEDYIFFPDEGSCKRYSSLLAELGKPIKNIGFGIKHRDWNTGKIENIEIFGPSPDNKRVILIDDICSYGGTAYYSAKELKELNCSDIYLYFTHTENSIAEGKLFNCGMIKKIYTTNSICTLEESDMLKIMKI